MSKTFVLGDPHGAHKAMLQVFEQSKFDYDSDTLICLGDVADGWPDTFECIDELRQVKNLIYVMGNHDVWLYNWLKWDDKPSLWTGQGGQATIESYRKNLGGWHFPDQEDIQRKHQKFFEKAVYYHIDDQNRIFVHGGFALGDPHFPWASPNRFVPNRAIYDNLIDTSEVPNVPQNLMWDRKLFYSKDEVKEFKEVYIGHTPTRKCPSLDDVTKPVITKNIYRMDTGAGWEGQLSMIDIDTKEVWQSEYCHDLYPETRGRR